MPLHLMLAAPGRGKTVACLQAMARDLDRPGPPRILLVPEQATDTMERQIQDVAGISHRLQVTSFRRLTWRIAQWTEGAALQPLGDGGRRLLLHAVLRRLGDQLEHFGRLERPGHWVGSLLAWLAEFRRHDLTPARLRAAAERLAGHPGDTLAARLRDAAKLLEEQERVVAGGWRDEDTTLEVAARLVPAAPFLSGACFWVDGFQDFTPVEEGFLKSLLSRGHEVHVTLPLDPERLDRHDGRRVYALALDTRERLREAALSIGAKVSEDLLVGQRPGRFRADSPLEHLVRHWGTPSSWPGDPAPAIRLLEAPDRTAEAEGVVADLADTVRRMGWRWRDVAILIRDAESEGPLLERAARRAGVPLFLDRRRPVEDEPLIRLVLSILTIWARHWPTAAVMDLLRNDLFPADQGTVDRLENEALAGGWEHGSWPVRVRQERDPGDPCGPLLQRLGDLVNTADKLGPAPTVRDLAEALMVLLDRWEVPNLMALRQDEALAEGRPLDAAAMNQARQILLDLLDQWVAVEGDAPLNLTDAWIALDTTLSAQTLGHVPATMDQVLAGTVDRTRTPDLKGVWLLGLEEGHLPARHQEPPLLDDADREQLLGLGCPAGPDTARRQEHERLRVLHALTRAGEMLTLSRPLRDAKGRDLAVSPTWAALVRMFPGLHPVLLPAVRTIQLERLPAPVPDFAPLKVAMPEALTASRLEAYATCPWLGFTRHVLKVEDRQGGRLEPLETGRLLHLALETFVLNLQREGLTWGELSPEDELARISLAIAAMEQAYRARFPRGDVWSERALARLGRRAGHVLQALGLTLRRGNGHPIGVEVGFGPASRRRPEDSLWLPHLSLPSADGHRHLLAGRMDRVDLFRTNGKSWLVVVDYKSGHIADIRRKLRTGEHLQLPLYLATVLQAAPEWLGVRPEAGGFAFALLHPEAEVADADATGGTAGERDPDDEDIPSGESTTAAVRLRPTRMRGRFLDDPDFLEALDRFLLPGSSSVAYGLMRNASGALRKGQGHGPEELQRLVSEALELAGTLADRMAAGAWAPLPIRRGRALPCTRCPVRRACRFKAGRDPHREVPGEEAGGGH